MPTGWDNCCEEEVLVDYGNRSSDTKYELKSKPEVLHAESNAIAKLAKSPESGEGASIFITHSPCIDCAKLIYQSGIATVYYKNNYRSTQGIEFLTKSDIEVVKV
jgi:dCMP deaminase